MNQDFKVPAKVILRELIKDNKIPKTAREYSLHIIYSVLNGRSKDDQVIEKMNQIAEKWA
jgi:hypothetical protein